MAPKPYSTKIESVLPLDQNRTVGIPLGLCPLFGDLTVSRAWLARAQFCRRCLPSSWELSVPGVKTVRVETVNLVLITMCAFVSFPALDCNYNISIPPPNTATFPQSQVLLGCQHARAEIQWSFQTAYVILFLGAFLLSIGSDSARQAEVAFCLNLGSRCLCLNADLQGMVLSTKTMPGWLTSLHTHFVMKPLGYFPGGHLVWRKES